MRPWALKKKPPAVTIAVSAPVDLALAGPALELVHRLAEVARALGAALGERAAVRVHRDPAVDQDPWPVLVPVGLDERRRPRPARSTRRSRSS